MNLAIVTSSYPMSRDDGAAAAGLFVRDFAQAVARNGHRVYVITQSKGNGCACDDAGVDVRCFDWLGGDRTLSRLKLHRPNDLRAAGSYFREGKKSLAALHKDVGVDHVLAMWAVPGGVIARDLKRKSGVSYSVWCLGSDIWSYGRIPVLRGIVARVLRGAENIYADGLELRTEAAALCKRTVRFLPSSRTLNAAGVEAASVDRESPKFLFIGRYDRVKGVDVLLAAMREYLDRDQRGSLRMFGGGVWDTHVKDLVSQYALEDHVDVCGYADGDTVISSLLDCDVLVIPSRMESIPLVLSDAVQLGVPVIVSDVGDMGTLIREIPAGLVVPLENVSALADAMVEFASSGPSIFERGVADLAAKFNLDTVATEFLNGIGATPEARTSSGLGSGGVHE